MKKTVFILSAGIIFLSAMCEKECPRIKTNYFDLPAGKAVMLKKILKTEDLDTLKGESLNVLRSYLKKKVLKGNPLDQNVRYRRISTQYFWYVYNALPEFVSPKERHHGYYMRNNKMSMKDKLIAYAFYRIDRGPENLRHNFTCIKPLLKKIITPEIYRSFNMGRRVQRLILSYRAVTKIKDYEEKLSSFYKQYFTSLGEIKADANPEVKKVYNGAYGFSSYVLSKLLSEKLGISRHDTLYSSVDLSFWMRRNHEGNMEAVYEILCEIQQMYGK